MKQTRKWLAALLSAVLILGAVPMAALAAEDPWDGAAEVEDFQAFKAALDDGGVEKIKITGTVTVPESAGTPEAPLKADKPIQVTERGRLLLDPGAAMTSDVAMGQFGYEDAENTWDLIAYGMAAFLMDGNDHRLLLGSLPEDVGEAIDGMTLAVLNGDVTVESSAEVRMLYVMNDGTLTIGKGAQLTVTGLIHVATINDFGELWADESVVWDIEDCDYNAPRVVACWNEERSEYSTNFAMTPYDEYEIEKFVVYDYKNGRWDYFDVPQAGFKLESPLSYGELEGHGQPVLTAKGAQWGGSYKISYEDYIPLRVFIQLPELGCYSAPGAATENILTGSVKCSPLSSGEFYVCVSPDAWFMKEGYTVSDLTVRCVRYREDGEEVLKNPPIAAQKIREGVWKLTAGGCDFNVETEVTVTSRDGTDSFEIGTGIYLEPAQLLLCGGAPLDGTDNGWGIPWKDAYKSTLRDTLSLKTGDSKDVRLYLLVYQGEAEGNKPAGWYCEPVHVNQIRTEGGVTVAQGSEDDDLVIRVTAGSTGTHKVIRLQEEEVRPGEWECAPGTTQGEPLTVTVSSSGSSGGGSSSGGSSSGGSSSGKPAGNSSYDISVPSGVTGGTVSVQPRNAKQGETVTITVRPEDGYELKTLTATTASGRKVETTDAGDGQYTFTMPGSKVTVRASFTKAQAETPAGSFADVASGAYYYDAVQWAVGKGITGGTAAGRFSPDAPCTRAQIVTFLWRAAGSPAPSGGKTPFKDVASGAYYCDAVQWAVEQGITGGTSAETFGPEAVVTRGQTAAFLYRAAGSPAAGGAASFTDVPSGAYYAQAVRWAAEQDITGGTGDGRFSPGAPCTRAQIVTFLYRSQKG